MSENEHLSAHDHPPSPATPRHPNRSRAKWVFVGFLAISAFFLITEHRAHLYGYLPWLILLACPLMHVFMHRGHGHGGHGHGDHGHSANSHDRDGEGR